MLELITKNWTLKLLSLTFALILWMFIMGERHLEVGYTVPLELQKIPKDLVIANQVPSLIDVRISGPRTLLMKVSPNDISIAVDLSDLKPGLTSFKRLDERLNLPSGMRVTRLSPSFVDIRLDRRKEKLVPIKVVFADDPDPGYRVSGLKTIPDKIAISGAESEIKSVSEVMTEPISLKGVTEGFSQIVPLVYEHTYSNFLNEKTAEIHVAIEPVAPVPETQLPANNSTEGGVK
ncbi:CdaR family protein [Geopsychrobacter electrodiphilus]|uniref:CdaR family protein n=1 Tax=Geopsychrobacter electrodiphilus TaxID=225196 RepID=UPI00038185E5|nr:CdaR family protein [Geopsychrobacter electrodiphilus]